MLGKLLSRFWIVLLGVALLTPNQSWALQNQLVELENPEPLPAIAFKDSEGNLLNLEEFKGKVILLNAWATWCAPCVEELPAFEKLQASHGDKGLVIVPVSIDVKGLPKVKRFFDNHNINLPIYLDHELQTTNAMQVNSLPKTIILDKKGIKRALVNGVIEWNSQETVSFLEKLLAED